MKNKMSLNLKINIKSPKGIPIAEVVKIFKGK